MKKPIVFMFSGQGSQYYHMGKELYERHPRFKLWMDYCNEILLPIIDASLIDVLYHQGKKSEPFDNILYTNPALLCIEYSLARVLMEMGIQPDYLLGYSLGEITAAVVSGAVSLHEGIELSVDYAKLLEKESPPAGMMAIIESTNIVEQFPELFESCWITGNNFKKNFVVGGLSESIQFLQSALHKKDIITQRLPVNYGFHTQLMDPLEEKFKQLIKRINLSPGKIPIISALKAEVIESLNDDYFWDVIRYPVEFEKTISLMLQKDDYIFIDVGPSGTLATFVKYLLPSGSKSLHLEVINQFGRDVNSIEKCKASLSMDCC